MDYVCPYCSGYSTTAGFVHDVNCPRFVQPDIYSPPAENLREKIVRMTQENDALKAENARLKELVTFLYMNSRVYTNMGGQVRCNDDKCDAAVDSKNTGATVHTPDCRFVQAAKVIQIYDYATRHNKAGEA